jgi:hypothetical protein
VLAAGVSGAGAPGLFGLLLLMEAGVPVPIPGDLVLLLVALAALAVALLVWWRRRDAAGRLLAEGCCPVCLVAGAAGLRRVRDEGTP